VGTWDAVAYSGDEPPSLRRLDSNKKYPRDIVGEEHSDGEIWSACLWQIRQAIGAQTANKLIIAHHSLLSPDATFEQAARQMIMTDQQLNGGHNAEAIREVFIKRGILPNPNRNNKSAGFKFSDIPSHNKRAGK
jgi:Zn-dependent metalloprotease